MFDISEVALRLGAATLIGAAIGLNRDLHGKPTGVRTLGLVALGAAAITFAAGHIPGTAGVDGSAMSRVMQGVLTGIGFLGAGVIIHEDANHRVRGLTTAACAWITACIGMVCGVGDWSIVLVTVPLVLLLLFLGGPLEKMARRSWKHDGETPHDG